MIFLGIFSLLYTPDEEKDTFTQFAAACKTLGIELEATSVPQRKGRVLSASYFYPHTYNNSLLCNKLPRTMCG